MNVTLRHVRAFLAVADLSSFSRAAERLRVAQPVLSSAVADLERELGVRLFDRTTRRVELTAAGREFRAGAAAAVAELERAARDVRSLGLRERGRLAVAAPPLLAACVLPAVIARMRATHPGITVTLMDVPTDAIVGRLRSGEADCGVGTVAPDEDGLARRRLARDRLMLFAPAGDPRVGGAGLVWRDLAGVRLVTLTRESGLRRLIDDGFAAAQTVPEIGFEVTQIATAVALVAQGLGVAVLPATAAAADGAGALRAVPLDEPTVERDISLVSIAGRSLSPAADAFGALVAPAVARLVATR